MRELKLLVTGATGFIGRRFCRVASEKGLVVRPALRRPEGMDSVAVGDINALTDWSPALEGVDTVVHLAARLHVMDEAAEDPLAEFRRVNVDGTKNLAGQAARGGVRRFVFLSSIKVNGEATLPGQAFTPDDIPNPQDPYAVSKYEAEQALRQVEKENGMEVVIIRPPMVYGPGVRGNFACMMRAVQSGLPLPLGLLGNRRSLVGLDNLVDLIIACIHHPDASGETFLVSDGEDLSMVELIRKLARAMDKRLWLLPVPPYLLKLGGAITGNKAKIERLIGSLVVDISHTCETLGWRPPVSFEEEIEKTGREVVKKAKRG